LSRRVFGNFTCFTRGGEKTLIRLITFPCEIQNSRRRRNRIQMERLCKAGQPI